MAAPLTTDALREQVAGLSADSKMVEANGLRLHVLDYPGDEPAVLVLPGITSPAISWDFVVRELALPRRFVVPDLRGRGFSDRPADGSYTLADYGQDVVDLAHGLGLDRPALLGHSMGARIAATVGARWPEVPGCVIAIDPPLSGPGRDPYPMTRAQFLAQLHEAQAGASLEEVQARYPRWPERELQLRVDWLATCDEQAIVKSHDGFHTEDFFDDWPKVRPPVVFVYGLESPMVTAEGAAEAAERNPRAEIVGVPGAGHMITWDNLEGFVSAVRPFLQAS